MDKLIHKPEGSIDERLSAAEDTHGREIVQLIMNGWSDTSIACYLGIDKYTITRFRRKYGMGRKFRCDGTPVFDEEKEIDYIQLERFGYNPYN